MPSSANFRIGHGYDVHRLDEKRELFLGGVKIPAPKGCLAHSDGDVLIHAICDALLGAANLGDIGTHFPDNDPQYKDISSTILLSKVLEKLNEKKFKVNNIDSTICLQKPKISPFIESIRSNLAHILRTEAVSVKATTTENLGFIGKEEGISAYAVALIHKTE
ncbi:MAG: 2-C-methyl-D-erythritol 2,4-cyclodiphosphate synthase [Bacteroidota bacterium]